MTTGLFNNQSFDIAVSDTVVGLRYGFREGCSFNTCGVSEFALFPSSERKFVVHPVLNLDHIFVADVVADVVLFCGHAQFGQNVEFISFYGV